MHVETGSLAPSAGSRIIQLRSVGNIGKTIDKESPSDEYLAARERCCSMKSATLIEIARATPRPSVRVVQLRVARNLPTTVINKASGNQDLAVRQQVRCMLTA